MKPKEKLKWWHSPYTVREKVDFLHYRIASPSARNRSTLPLENEPMSWRSGAEGEVTKIGFIGDFMPIGDRTLVLGEGLKSQLSGLDYVVINVEGVVTSQRRYLAVAFDEGILAQVQSLFPQKIIFNVANNHSADFGSSAFAEHLERLRRYGQIVGHDDNGLLLPEGIFLRSATMLSNQPLEVCAQAKVEDARTIASVSHDHSYNIFLPHWGYEMHLYPEVEQARFAEHLLDGGWDAVVGSHPHVPQPLWSRADGKMCLFSLGNFCYENVNPNHSYGKLLTLDIIYSSDTPELGAFQQFYTRQELIGRDGVRVHLEAEIDYHYFRAHRPRNLRYLSDLIK